MSELLLRMSAAVQFMPINTAIASLWAQLDPAARQRADFHAHLKK